MSAVLLGLSGFVVLAVAEVAGEVESVRRGDRDGGGLLRVWCGRRGAWPAAGDGGVAQPTVALPGADLSGPTWSETSGQVRPRAVLTEHARGWAMRRVGEHGETVTSVCRQLQVGWHTVLRAVRDYGQPLVTTRPGYTTWRRSASTSTCGATPDRPGAPAIPPASST